MTIDLDNLEKLAKAATPGPWKAQFPNPTSVLTPKVLTADGGILLETMHYGRMNADAAFVAAANPKAILELIAEVRNAQLRDAERLRPGHACDFSADLKTMRKRAEAAEAELARVTAAHAEEAGKWNEQHARQHAVNTRVTAERDRYREALEHYAGMSDLMNGTARAALDGES